MILASVPQDVKVYDNRGEWEGNPDGTHDRYAVVFPDGACYTMSAYPFGEGGVCRFESMGYSPQPGDVIRNQVPSQVVAKIYEILA